ncbi:MAG: hypothetical protein AB7H80_17410 [Candidatus Kapaibacterium sp.]
MKTTTEVQHLNQLQRKYSLKRNRGLRKEIGYARFLLFFFLSIYFSTDYCNLWAQVTVDGDSASIATTFKTGESYRYSYSETVIQAEVEKSTNINFTLRVDDETDSSFILTLTYDYPVSDPLEKAIYHDLGIRYEMSKSGQLQFYDVDQLKSALAARMMNLAETVDSSNHIRILKFLERLQSPNGFTETFKHIKYLFQGSNRTYPFDTEQRRETSIDGLAGLSLPAVETSQFEKSKAEGSTLYVLSFGVEADQDRGHEAILAEQTRHIREQLGDSTATLALDEKISFVNYWLTTIEFEGTNGVMKSYNDIKEVSCGGMGASIRRVLVRE